MVEGFPTVNQEVESLSFHRMSLTGLTPDPEMALGSRPVVGVEATHFQQNVARNYIKNFWKTVAYLEEGVDGLCDEGLRCSSPQ
jgi:hypothetical protein